MELYLDHEQPVIVTRSDDTLEYADPSTAQRLGAVTGGSAQGQRRASRKTKRVQLVGGPADGERLELDAALAGTHLRVGALLEPGSDAHDALGLPGLPEGEDPQPIVSYEWYLLDGGKLYHHSHDKARGVRFGEDAPVGQPPPRLDDDATEDDLDAEVAPSGNRRRRAPRSRSAT